MDRRRFLGLSSIALLGVGLGTSACTSTSAAAPTTSTGSTTPAGATVSPSSAAATSTSSSASTAVKTVTATSAPAGPATRDAKAAIADLRKQLQGRVILPGDPQCAVASAARNGRYANLQPAVIAQCADEADVVTAVNWGRENGLPPVVRGGGHSYAGFSSTTGFEIDLSRLNEVKIDARTGSAVMGGSALNKTAFEGALGGRWILPAGTCGLVALGGLTLGGGIGYHTHWAGLTSDHLVSTRVVTADGSVVVADRSSHPDLFWACRGGSGGSFGVDTSFEYQLAEISMADSVYFRFDWRGADAATSMLTAVDGILQKAPAELNISSSATATPVAKGGPREAVDVVSRGHFLGSVKDLTDLLKPLMSVPRRTNMVIKQQPFWETAKIFVSNEAIPHSWGDISRYVNKPVPSAVYAKLVDMVAACPIRTADSNGAIWSLGTAPEPADQSTQALDPVVAYIMATEKVDQTEASRRAAVESHSTALATEARNLLGKRFSAVYVAKNSSLVVTAAPAEDSDQSAIITTAESLGLSEGDVSLISARFSEVDYTQGTVDVVNALKAAKLNNGFSVGADPEAQNPTVTVDPEADVEKALIGITEIPIIVDHTGAPQPASSTCDQTFDCNAPMRGGMRIGPFSGSNTAQSNCTAGFNVTSNSNGVTYLLTAGHCLFERVGQSEYGYQLGPPILAHTIGPIHGTSYNNTANGDAGIVQVTNPTASGWANRPWILLYDGPSYSGGGAPPTQDLAYVITDQGSPTMLQRVCQTGVTAKNTACGQVLSTGQFTQYCSNSVCHNITGTATTSICTRGGDSGGPVFSSHIAYAIVSGGSWNGTDTATHDTCTSNSKGIIYPILFAEADLNVTIMTGSRRFKLIFVFNVTPRPLFLSGPSLTTARCPAARCRFVQPPPVPDISRRTLYLCRCCCSRTPFHRC